MNEQQNSNLPRLMDPETVKREFFNGVTQPKLNLPAVYALFRQDGFPSMRIGRKWYTVTSLFIDWLEKQCREKNNI